jgi:TrmH family RNA methyltransferase
MLSKNKIKFIRSLQQKKMRNETECFVVEGRKGIEELLKADWKIKELYVSESIALKFSSLLSGKNFTVESENSIESASGLKNNKEGIAVVSFKTPASINWTNGYVLYLDNVSDPGNLGTIIRTADWFGISHVICNDCSVDFYNPKVIQSTMGAFTRVVPSYINVDDLKTIIPNDYPVYATFLDGESPNRLQETENGLLVMGSESHGVSESFLELNPIKISIPSGADSVTESLNVAIATSILCYEINREG